MEGFLGIGGNELFIILIFAFLIFGPDKLPDIARTIGRAIARFRDAQNEVNEVIRQEVYDPAVGKETPFKQAADRTPSPTQAPGSAKGADSRNETFAERKARYDRIRAERKAKEEAAAKEAAARGEAAKEAAVGEAAAKGVPGEGASDSAADVSDGDVASDETQGGDA